MKRLLAPAVSGLLAACGAAPERTASPASDYVFADTEQLAHFGAPNSAPTSHLSVFAPAGNHPEGGCVVLRFDIGPDGSAIDPQIDFASAPGVFDRYALASVRESHWIRPVTAGPYYFWLYYSAETEAEAQQRQRCTELRDARKTPQEANKK